MKLITKLIEPKKILVIWQSPDVALKQPSGVRFIVGEITNHLGEINLRYYDNPDVKVALTKGFNGLTAYPYEVNKYFHGNVIDTLSKRLPPSSRGDYEDYLKSYRISPDAEGITTLSLLAYTAGKLEGDGFSFIHTFEDVTPPLDFTFEVAGFRYSEGMKFIDSLMTESAVVLLEDNENKHDQEAVLIAHKKGNIGHAPRGLNSVLRRFMKSNKVNTVVAKVNGSKARPNVLIYVEVR